MEKNVSNSFFFTFYFPSYPLKVFWNGVYSKMKDFAPNESKFFSFGVDTFSEGMQNHFDQVDSSEVSQCPLTQTNKNV